MKKIFLLLISFVFILTGCSDPGTVDYYIDNGYTDLGEVGPGYTMNTEYDETSYLLEKQISDTEVVTIMYDNDVIYTLEARYSVENVVVNFEVRNTDDLTYCSVRTESDSTEVPCQDAYAYLVENAPDLANEIKMFYTDFDMEGSVVAGNAQNVEDIINEVK